MRKRTLLLSITAAGIAGAALFGWVTIRRGFSARDNPSAIETYVAKTARRLSIPASERNATNPFASTPEVLSDARAHFADHCAICHGNDGKATVDVVADATDLTAPKTWKNGTSEREIFKSIREGRGSSMPAFKTHSSAC